MTYREWQMVFFNYLTETMQCSKKLLHVLNKVASYSSINQMTYKDLAFALGPYMIHKSVDKKEKQNETKEDNKIQKEKEKENKKASKEEKMKLKEIKKLADKEKLEKILKIMETPYEFADDIRLLVEFLIEYSQTVFVNNSSLSSSKKGFTR